MTGKVLVNLKESKHIAVIGEIGFGKSNYARKLVEQALKENPELEVYVFGAREDKWKELSHMGLVRLYSMEETIQGGFEEMDGLDTTKDTLVVLDDIGHTIQMLPPSEHSSIVANLHKVLTEENVFSIVTSFRPLAGYYPKEILDLSNTKIALVLEHESDYATFFESKAYKNNPEKLNNPGEAYIDTKTTKEAVYIESVKEVELKIK